MAVREVRASFTFWKLMEDKLNQLNGKIAIVTGASRGLGRAISLKLASAGAHIVALDLRQDWAQVTADLIISAGGKSMGLGCDVSDSEAVALAMSETEDKFGGLDILVNNAMWNRYEPIADITPATADRMVGVGFNAIVWAIQEAAPLMRQRGGGSIINIASVSAQLGIPNGLLYCGIKAGVTGLTRAAAVELGPDNIRVNAISPSTIATEGVKAILDPEKFADRVARTPLRRLGEPDDIANASVFLASDAANFVTGQVLTVDGGLANAFI
tara:strand:+ start:19106 stop:19918 length:813 start_codon:yes stop_codon:yes gene_type:complete